jgi:hypothetical protein
MTSWARFQTASPVAMVVASGLLFAGCPPPELAERRTVLEKEASPDVAICLQGGPFVADGAVEARSAEPGDAYQPAGFRWEPHEGCERVVVDLLDREGRPAERVGRIEAEVHRDLGVVRLELRDVPMGNYEATDATFEGPLARFLHVVSSPDGRWLYLDVHLGEAAEAHVTTLEEPARVVIDLRPGGPALPGPAPRETRVVVLEPRPGPASYPLQVTGYSRTFEANVVVRLEQEGEEIHSDFTTATGWLDAWGHFNLTIDQGPGGRVVLHVGEQSAKDGTWEGVAIELEMR